MRNLEDKKVTISVINITFDPGLMGGMVAFTLRSEYGGSLFAIQASSNLRFPLTIVTCA